MGQWEKEMDIQTLNITIFGIIHKYTFALSYSFIRFNLLPQRCKL